MLHKVKWYQSGHTWSKDVKIESLRPFNQETDSDTKDNSKSGPKELLTVGYSKTRMSSSEILELPVNPNITKENLSESSGTQIDHDSPRNPTKMKGYLVQKKRFSLKKQSSVYDLRGGTLDYVDEKGNQVGISLEACIITTS